MFRRDEWGEDFILLYMKYKLLADEEHSEKVSCEYCILFSRLKSKELYVRWRQDIHIWICNNFPTEETRGILITQFVSRETKVRFTKMTLLWDLLSKQMLPMQRWNSRRIPQREVREWLGHHPELYVWNRRLWQFYLYYSKEMHLEIQVPSGALEKHERDQHLSPIFPSRYHHWHPRCHPQPSFWTMNSRTSLMESYSSFQRNITCWNILCWWRGSGARNKNQARETNCFKQRTFSTTLQTQTLLVTTQKFLVSKGAPEEKS